MPTKNSQAEESNVREPEMAPVISLTPEQQLLEKVQKEKAEITEMLERFEARMRAAEKKDKSLPYCPVRDGHLYPFYFPRQVMQADGKLKWTTDPEWVTENHPCVKERFVPKSESGKFALDVTPTFVRPLRPGEAVPTDKLVKPAKDWKQIADHMLDLADTTPQHATIPQVVIENGVVKEAF
jgi:hypothetical protein